MTTQNLAFFACRLFAEIMLLSLCEKSPADSEKQIVPKHVQHEEHHQECFEQPDLEFVFHNQIRIELFGRFEHGIVDDVSWEEPESGVKPGNQQSTIEHKRGLGPFDIIEAFDEATDDIGEIVHEKDEYTTADEFVCITHPDEDQCGNMVHEHLHEIVTSDFKVMEDETVCMEGQLGEIVQFEETVHHVELWITDPAGVHIVKPALAEPVLSFSECGEKWNHCKCQMEQPFETLLRKLVHLVSVFICPGCAS